MQRFSNGFTGSVGRRRFLETATVSVVAVSSLGRVSGTNEVIEIADWDDLAAVRDDLAAEYLLVDDLDEDTAGYDEHVSAPDRGWEPIGSITPANGAEDAFSGRFEGNGNEISDLVIDRPEDGNVGLFAGNAGTIEGLSLVDCEITGGTNTGSLVGRNVGELETLSVRGTVDGDEWIGGLVGQHEGELRQSTASASVSGEQTVGGLVGLVRRGTVRQSTAGGTVTGEFGVGGLAGEAWGRVSASLARAEVTGDNAVGGLIGQIFEEDGVIGVHASSDVDGEWGVGGLVGWNVGETVREVSASGVVTGTESVGGVIGSNEGILREAFATPTVSGTDDVGGVIGVVHADGEASRSYWDIERTGQSAGVGRGNGDVTGHSTQTMQGETAEETMAALDFDQTWTVVTDPPDYPALQCEAEKPAIATPASPEAETETDDDADDTGVGFGVGSVLAGLGGLGYLLKRRAASKSE